MMSCAEIDSQLAAYALGVLDREEVAEVETHLSRCRQCRANFRAMQAVVEDLPLSVDLVNPSGALERRIFEQTKPARFVSVRSWRWPLAAAAMLVVTIASLGWGLFQQAQLAELSRERAALADQIWAQDKVAEVLASPQLASFSLVGDAAAPNAQGRVYIEPSKDMGMMSVQGLPELPPGRAYQIWLIEGDQRISGGLFTVDSSGSAYVIIRASAPLGQYQAVGVTNEPATGSPGPTTPRVIGGRLQF